MFRQLASNTVIPRNSDGDRSMTHLDWQFVHILLFVAWLGGDIGVFVSMFFVKDSSLPYASRVAIIRLAFYVDLFPRCAFALMIPVGVMLATGLGVLPRSGFLIWSAWVVGVAWAVAHILLVVRKGTNLAARLRRLNVGFEALVGAGLIALGGLSMAGFGPIAAPWFAFKLLLFGVIFWVVLGIDVKFQPFTMLLQAGADGLTLERESAIRRSTNMTLAWALLLYALIVAVAWTGKFKTFPPG